MLFGLFSVFVGVLCTVLGWFMHKVYLHNFVYRPTRLNILRYSRRSPRIYKRSNAMRKWSRKQSLVKKAKSRFVLDELLGKYDDF
jgi:hypothetical protein